MLRRRSQRQGRSETPYATRTPRTRNLTQAMLPHADRENGIRFQELLCFRKWRAHRVTPLVYFSYEDSKLLEYSHVLQSYLEIGQKKNAAVLIGQQSAYSVVLSVIKGIACTETDYDAVKITISPRAESESTNTVFTGILLSVERERHYDDKLRSRSHLCHLPLFLASGSAAFTNIVVNFLENTFGCFVKPLTFSSSNLMWMLAMWAVNQYEDGNKPLMLEYALPYKELHTIQYTLDAKTIKTVWSSVHVPESNVMHATEVEAFVKSLERHFWVLFKVELSNFRLRSIGTPAAAVHTDGAFKIFNPNAMRHILRHLTSLAQEIEIC